MNQSEIAESREKALLPAQVPPRKGPAVWKHGPEGFTLVELFIVVVIIGALILISIPALTTLKERAKVARSMEEIRGLERDIIAYASERGTLPDDLGQINHAGMRDPWGSDYVYTPPSRVSEEHPRRVFTISEETLNEDFDLYSKGMDKASAGDVNDDSSRDDIVRAGNGSFVGLVPKLSDF